MVHFETKIKFYWKQNVCTIFFLTKRKKAETSQIWKRKRVKSGKSEQISMISTVLNLWFVNHRWSVWWPAIRAGLVHWKNRKISNGLQLFFFYTCHIALDHTVCFVGLIAVHKNKPNLKCKTHYRGRTRRIWRFNLYHVPVINYWQNSTIL